MIERIILSWAI